jgi:glutamate 5-kinase
MSSKLEAIKIAAGSGISSIIASGKSPDSLLKAARGEPVGTFFPAQGESLKARERWIAYGARTRGTIIVDQGAKNALVKNGKSLLSVGIINVIGSFKQNETVSIAGPAGSEFARGKANFSARELQSHIGMRREQEVIHRNNLVIL